MNRDDISNQYFDWLVDVICKNRFSKSISYKKLLMRLHSIIYRPGKNTKDRNRFIDGENLRYRFSERREVLDCLEGPCSVLEMMVALSIRCEETIMDNPEYGDRTGQWFWQMISSMGLGYMTDDIFDKDSVDSIVNRMMDRKYSPNGKGGLFTIRGFNGDLRNEDIWTQLCWYLDSIA